MARPPSTLKRELGTGHHQVWASLAAAHSAIFECIEGWFNPRQLHSSVGHCSLHPQCEAVYAA